MSSLGFGSRTSTLSNTFGSISGISLRSISSFFIDAKRFQSVLDLVSVDGFFTDRGLSGGYDSDDRILRFCKYHDSEPRPKMPYANPTIFAVVRSLVEKSHHRVIKHLRHVDKIDAVPLNI